MCPTYIKKTCVMLLLFVLPFTVDYCVLLRNYEPRQGGMSRQAKKLLMA